MKITKLIKVYEKLLPIYKKAHEEDFSYSDLYWSFLNFGICYASDCILGIPISKPVNRYYSNLFIKKGHLKGLYLFPEPRTGKDLKTRIDFMESEIKDLKRLIKKGYTHV